MPSGRVNLYVKALSAEGDILEFMVENFQGIGKYQLGSSYYTNSWMKFESPLRSESWLVGLQKTLNLNANYIEISSVRDNYIEGKIFCSEMMNDLDGLMGAMEGEFRLVDLE
ncbi:hypothetical protein FLP08_10245 [Gramella aestuarii]|uniref:Uncharacterized protein n=2 Tax=Christiangramia aestuarii TaxID=1028746 RepID=A0A7K1LQ94_9FLAO|nr:hypothetical protein [Christiangramia aestuarii]MUP42956.1 hypothetical protein [Christiangramia aestuarii]